MQDICKIKILLLELWSSLAKSAYPLGCNNIEVDVEFNPAGVESGVSAVFLILPSLRKNFEIIVVSSAASVV